MGRNTLSDMECDVSLDEGTHVSVGVGRDMSLGERREVSLRVIYNVSP